jgi:hypothetical protein
VHRTPTHIQSECASLSRETTRVYSRLVWVPHVAPFRRSPTGSSGRGVTSGLPDYNAEEVWPAPDGLDAVEFDVPGGMGPSRSRRSFARAAKSHGSACFELKTTKAR